MTGRLPDPAPHLRDADAKRRYTRVLFDTIAPRYDAFTRGFSLGMDRRWKRRLVRAVVRRLPPRARGLDVACGTGDLLEMLRRYGGPAVRVTGLDQSLAMAGRARRRVPDAAVVCGDLSAIPLPATSVDAVTAGYGLRNAPDLAGALAEIRRVLRPGGVLATLDFYQPSSAWWRRLFRWYLRHAGRLVGRWWHGDPHAYGYIAASLRAWMTADDLTRALARHGFRVEECARYLGGGIAVHVARG